MKINIFLFLQIFLILKFTLWNVLSSTLSESKYYFFRFFPFSNLPLNFVCFLSLKMLKTFLWNKYFVSNLTITNCRLFLKFLIHNTFSTLTRTKARVDRLVTQNPHHLPWLRPIPEPISPASGLGGTSFFGLGIASGSIGLVANGLLHAMVWFG